MFLECAWEALEGAGYCPVEPGPQVGVFGGCAYPDYLMDHLMSRAGEPGATLLFAIGNERDSLTSLVSYKLGLSGPSVAVQTFCSTSLVAVHLACQSLLTYECDLALAGGAFLPLPQPTGYKYQPGGILSPDGKLRSFDASGNGSVMGAGVGVVALKRMQDALADGDVIHAVVLGSAVNNDGRARVGYTAPGVDGQASVMETAQAVAGVKPESIGYVECHATGTQLGDSIELAALIRVFPESPQSPTVLSSVKPMLGHLDRAAGVTGLIRATLHLRHAILPGTAGFEEPNETLAAAGDRFEVSAFDRPWPAGPLPRRAGVSSFGLGGTNAHVVLEEPPARPARPAEPGPHLLTFSAADPAALAQYAERLADHLSTNPDEELGDVSFTLQVSRGHFALRRAVVCRDPADAVAALGDPDRWIDGETRRRDPFVRLLVGAVDPGWWRELAGVAARLLAAEDGAHLAAAAGASTVTEAEALAVLTEALSLLGVRIADQASSAPAGVDAVTVLIEPDGSAADAWFLSVLARLWQEGATIDWSALHRGRGRRVTLPTYPFQRSRYWVAARAAAAVADAPAEGRVDDLDQWTYLPAWQRSTPPEEDLEARLRATGPWLVFAAEQRGEALVERLIRAGAEVFVARPGEQFGQDEIGDFTVRPGDADDAAELLGSLLVAPATVVYGFSLASPRGEGAAQAAHFDAQSALGFSGALALVRALVGDPDPAPLDLVVLTGGAVGVLGEDLTHPEHAGLASLPPTIAQENPRLACRSIDVGEPGAPHTVKADAESVLAAASAPHQGPVAVRGGEVWLRVYEQHPLAVPDASRPAVRRGETVLITGGLGALGLTLARHLADAYGSRLVLTGRTPLPPREQWEHLKDGADRTARQIRAILDLEDRGARVLALAADVDDEEQMRGVVQAAVERFGRIDVVVHGAGVQDPRFFDLVHLVEPEVCDAHFRAKVHGFHVLQKVLGDLGDQAPDRRIAVSSLTPILGGVLHGPYAAANAALDAYARAARLRGEGRWVTVNFEAWHAAPDLDAVGDQPEGEYEMAPREGVDIFERALAAVDRVAHVTVSTGPLAPRVRRWVVGGGAGAADGLDLDADRERHPRPPLSTPYVEPAQGLECTVARVWDATLGLESVGAKDDFFELGGNSLIAIDLTARLREVVGCDVAVTALVQYPTVRSLTRLIEETLEEKQAA
jgi:acyl transferase domain-containing protein/acyl carrier protein